MLEEQRPTALKANLVFRKAQFTIDKHVASSFRDHGVTETQFGVLDYLLHKGEQKIGQLLTGVLATSGNMTVVLRNMEKKGWIYRRVCPSDKRASLIGLTESGRKVIEACLPDHLDRVREAMSVLTEAEQEQLIELLKKFKNL